PPRARARRPRAEVAGTRRRDRARRRRIAEIGRGRHVAVGEPLRRRGRADDRRTDRILPSPPRETAAREHARQQRAARRVAERGAHHQRRERDPRPAEAPRRARGNRRSDRSEPMTRRLIAAGALFALCGTPLAAQRALWWNAEISGIGMRLSSETGPSTTKLSGASFGFQSQIVYHNHITIDLGYWHGNLNHRRPPHPPPAHASPPP